MVMLLGTASLWARPATKGAVSVKQPDGTTVTIRLIGDEYMHYNTTDDGYSLVRNDKGFYVYAQKVDGQLKPTDIIAHDEKLRTATELAFLATTTKHLAPEMSQTSEQVRHSDRLSRVQALHAMRADRYDYSKFKGLVILVEYNDCKFQNTNYKDIMEGMINQENYTGTDKTNIYRNVGSNWRHIANDIICTGSMRDYFRDNSNGVFNPTFDIVGPVSVNRSQFYPNGGNSAYDNNVRTIQLLTDVFTAADSQVNFADYDVNKDGKGIWSILSLPDIVPMCQATVRVGFGPISQTCHSVRSGKTASSWADMLALRSSLASTVRMALRAGAYSKVSAPCAMSSATCWACPISTIQTIVKAEDRVLIRAAGR